MLTGQTHQYLKIHKLLLQSLLKALYQELQAKRDHPLVSVVLKCL